MLHYNNQYDIANGIFLTFDKNLANRKMTSNHSIQVREKTKSSFPYMKYSDWTKERFAISIIYLMYKKKPPSFKNLIQMLYDLDEKEVKKFKAEIINYEVLVSRDVEFLVQKYGSKPSEEDMFFEYSLGNIKFYTLWFYLKKINADIDNIMNSRIKGVIIRRIKTLLLFVSFSEEKLKKIDILLKERLDI
jgi:phosphoenolpyruvate synthase/pyruvate phosphate dikinase